MNTIRKRVITILAVFVTVMTLMAGGSSLQETQASELMDMFGHSECVCCACAGHRVGSEDPVVREHRHGAHSRGTRGRAKH